MKATYQPTRKKDGMIVDQILSGGHMLINRKVQNIHEESLVQNYDLGTRLVVDDRVFRYSKAGTALVAMMGGHCGNLPTEVNSHAVASVAGSNEVTILDANARVVDYYAGGYIWTMNLTSGVFEMYRIKSSAVSAGTSILLTLEEALAVELPATTWLTAWPNIYGNILGTASGFMSQVVVALRPVQNGYYFWGQTWGPCFGTVVSSTPGRLSTDREIFFNIDGALHASVDVAPESTNPIPQRAGFLITNTSPGGAGYGDQLYMLQISP